MGLSASFVAAAIIAAVTSNVLQLKPDHWDTTIDQGFAPWYMLVTARLARRPADTANYVSPTYTETLAPVYKQLADTYAHVKDKVIITKVNANGEGKPLGSKYGVTGFPSGQDLDTLASLSASAECRGSITTEAGVKSNIKPPSAARDPYPRLSHLRRGGAGAVVRQLQEHEAYLRESFPLIKFFPKGSTEPEAYEGGRTEKESVNLLNEKCGMRIKQPLPEFDALASKFFVATRNVHDLSFKDAKLVTGTEGSLEKETKHEAQVDPEETVSPSRQLA
ncbi:protein disulfide isomerase [Mycena belliarum]|uniref:Protein disulfide isomerase n=1 Tax=Mycena belliarum TaxID=1033014 RepID=A0AAD6XJ23_9AGAR|nr:protein disulfide isomerase [Mycena belliae]